MRGISAEEINEIVGSYSKAADMLDVSVDAVVKAVQDKDAYGEQLHEWVADLVSVYNGLDKVVAGLGDGSAELQVQVKGMLGVLLSAQEHTPDSARSYLTKSFGLSDDAARQIARFVSQPGYGHCHGHHHHHGGGWGRRRGYDRGYRDGEADAIVATSELLTSSVACAINAASKN